MMHGPQTVKRITVSICTLIYGLSFRLVVAGLSLQRHDFDPRLELAKYVVYRILLGQSSLRLFSFSLSVPFHENSSSYLINPGPA